MFVALGRALYRWRVLVLALWSVVIIVGGVVGVQIFDRATSVESLSHDADSVRAQQLLEERLGDGPEVLAVASGRHPRDPELVQSIIDVGRQLNEIDGVVEVRDGFTIEVSSDGTTWSPVAEVTGNTEYVTSHDVAAAGRYVRLNVITPASDGNDAARVYEVEVYGTT